MKPTQQQKDNKLIAKFMGLTIITDNISYFDTDYKPLKKYNEDWNWLMQVVEKIESLEYLNKKSTCEGFDSFGIEINKNRCDITHYGDFTHHLLQGNGKTRIESTYNACVGFIKWYNEQNR